MRLHSDEKASQSASSLTRPPDLSAEASHPQVDLVPYEQTAEHDFGLQTSLCGFVDDRHFDAELDSREDWPTEVA